MAEPIPEYVFEGRGGHCNICVPVVQFTSAVTARDHIQGSKHQKTLRFRRDRVHELGANYLQQFIDSPNSHVSPPPIPKEDNIDRLQEMLNVRLDMGSNTSMLDIPENEGVLMDSTGSGQCLICGGKQLTSMVAAQEHIRGEKHRKNKVTNASLVTPINSPYQEASKPSPPEQISGKLGIEYDDRECFVCNVVFTSDVTRQQHIVGSKHLKLLRRMAESQGESMGIDKTLWYRCDVCEVSVNSEEQFEKHKLGKRHIVREQQHRQKQSSSLGLSQLTPESVRAPGHGRPVHNYSLPASTGAALQIRSGAFGLTHPSRDDISYENPSAQFSAENPSDAYIPRQARQGREATLPLLSMASEGGSVEYRSSLVHNLPFDSVLDGHGKR